MMLRSKVWFAGRRRQNAPSKNDIIISVHCVWKAAYGYLFKAGAGTQIKTGGFK